jgi:hypothetical protein
MKAASEGIKGIQGLIKEARALTSQALTASATTGKVTGTATLTAGTTVDTTLGLDVGDTLIVGTATGAPTSTTYTVVASDTVQTVMDAINADTATKGIKASLTSDGKLQFENVKGGDVYIAGSADTGELTALGLTAGTTTGTVNATRTSLAQQFDALRSEIDRIANDAGINGTNLLKGDKITLALNEDGSSSTTIQGSTVSSTSLSIDAASNKWQADSSVNDALSDLIAAADSLEGTAASFSSNQSIINARSEFNASLSDILKSASSQLTAADMDQEAANLVALQTRQQMAVTSLSIIQSSESTALRLIS